MANSFNLRRGGLSMCPGDTCSEELQMRAAPNAHRLALLYSEKQASKLQKQVLLLSLHSSELWRSFALGSGGTICLSPVDKLISDDDLSLFLIHSSDLQGFLFSNAYNCLALFPSSQHSPISLSALMSQILESY